MVRVLATGVFDLLHPGHLSFLEESKKLGDELFVIVSNDKTAKKIKKRWVLPQEQRATMVGALKIVDRALVGDSEDLFKLLPIIKPDVITLGFDQDISEEWLEDRLNRLGMQIKVIRIKKHLRGRFFSTSKILEAACRETKIKG